MLISLFSVLDSPFGIFPLGWVSRSFGFSVLVVPFAVSGLGWVVFSLAVRGLDCELGMLVSIFSAHVCPFAVSACALGTLVSAFAVSGHG